jgi:hypothetical protein
MTGEVDSLYESLQRTKLAPLELELLVPTLKGQLEALRDLLAKVKEIAQAPQTVAQLDLAIGAIVQDPSGDARRDARKYLDDVAFSVDDSFTGPINAALAAAPLLVDLAGLRRWIAEVNLVASSVVRNRDLLFVYKARSFVLVKNERTRAQSTVPNEWTISLYPFEVTVQECSRIALSMTESIAAWSKGQQDAVLKLSELRAAEATREAGKRQLSIQVALIILTLCLSLLFTIFQDAWSRRSEVKDLEWRLRESQAAEKEAVLRTQHAIEELSTERDAQETDLSRSAGPSVSPKVDVVADHPRENAIAPQSGP